VGIRHRWQAAVMAMSAAILSVPNPAHASSGTEGASFLDIPIGGRPAAMGGAYSALANDADAPVWNPGGLGELKSVQLTAMHLDYVESIGYEYLSFVLPAGTGNGLGAAVQYLHPKAGTALDENGNGIGAYSAYYAAYSLAYGHAFNDALSVGVTGKVIDARISDVSGQAYAADVGGLYRLGERWRLAAVADNLGSKLKFLDQGDNLPQSYRLGILFSPAPWNLSADGAYDKTGLFSGRIGAEWKPMSFVAVRAGYRTDTERDLPGVSGVAAGAGLEYAGQRFDYAWTPMGDMGQVQYFSIMLRFGKGDRP